MQINVTEVALETLKKLLAQDERIKQSIFIWQGSVVEVEEKPAFHLHLLITKKVKTF